MKENKMAYKEKLRDIGASLEKLLVEITLGFYINNDFSAIWGKV